MSDDLPEGWAEASLKDLVGPDGMFTDGDWILSKHLKTGNDVRLIQLADVGVGHFLDRSQKFISHETAESLRVTFLHENDVLISRMADPLARACLLPRIDRLAITAVDVSIARCDGSCSVPAFLMRVCNSGHVLKQAEESAVGTTRKRISRKNLEAIRVFLPPVPEQCRIVAKLEELLGKVDACKERLAKVPVLLKRFRLAVVAAACSGRLTADWRERNSIGSLEGVSEEVANDLPVGWRRVSVGEVVDTLRYGTARKCSYERCGVPVLRIPNVVNGTVDHVDLKYAELPVKEAEQLALDPGDILLIRSNGSVSLVGKCAVVLEEERGFAYAGYLIRIRPRSRVVASAFLALALGSYDVRLQIELEARSTSGVNNINGDELRALRFALPSLAEQREVVRRVKVLLAMADEIETRFANARAEASRLPPCLLAKAFRGELVATEAKLARREGRSFEPASVLLQRIRSEHGGDTAVRSLSRGRSADRRSSRAKRSTRRARA